METSLRNHIYFGTCWLSNHHHRMNATTIDDLLFCGNDDEDVTRFFHSLLRLALAAGHQRDDAWLMDHLEASLSGGALQYYVNLEDDSKMDFKRARSSLINRFGHAFGPPAAIAAAPPAPLPQQPPLPGRSAFPVSIGNTPVSLARPEAITPISKYAARNAVSPQALGPRAIILFYESTKPHYGFTNYSPHPIDYQGVAYPTSEHLFQALKVQGSWIE